MIRKFFIASIYAVITVGSTNSFGQLTGEIKSSYYKNWPLFHMYPNEEAAKQTLKRVGPIGISLDLLQPAFTMRIAGVEEGSPAAATGKLKKGQYIESINGKVLKDKDPRVILGNLITAAEATDGILKMMVKEDRDAAAQKVIVKIPVLGTYRDTWPMNCEKSNRIVRNFADFLAAQPRGWGSALFLLSTGEEKDLDVVRGWFSGKLPENMAGHPWSIGYTGPAICEYYLRTGDKTVLPAIQSMADYLKETIYNGSWMGRGGANFNYMAGGHMNAAGVHSVTFLLLAKECGVDVDEHTLQSSLRHFYRYAGHWNVPYGDGLPEGGGVDNGKNGGLAFAMAAAASLTPEGENSVYAKARDISANKSFYTTSWLFHGHTGGGIGEIWRGAAMGLLAEKRPEPYRSFMNERRWMYELARTHDGAFGWSSTWNVSYDNTGHGGGRAWGNYIPLVYTIPRKQLRIFGAPPTKYSRQYQLPTPPWGTAADEAFFSLAAGEYRPGKQQELSKERLPTHASWPILRQLKDPQVSDEDLLMFAHHPDSTSRGTAAGAIKDQGRDHLIPELLNSKDPRARLSGVQALGGKLTDDQITILGKMISDREESWWVIMEAMEAISHAPAQKIAPYFDSLINWLEHDDWWLRHAALQAVTPLVADKAYYKRILPIIGRMIATNQRAVALNPLRGIVSALKKAEPEVQQYALQVFSRAYSNFPAELKAPGGQNLSNGVDYLVKSLARNVASMPGGFDALYEVSQERFPGNALPHKTLYMQADSKRFGPKVKEALKPVVREYLIPQYMAEGNHIASNREYLINEATSAKPLKWNYYYREPRMAQLLRFYNRIGVHEYDWQDFGPDLTEIKWDYHTFDPPEKKLWEPGTRYREVTYPEGMEEWYKPNFDAAAVGWGKGFAPFGQVDGKLGVGSSGCSLNFCRCSEPMKTLWENEVLITRAKVTFPPFKEDHRYRLVVGGMSHVNAGDGFRVYVNGKLMKERERGVGKREGAKPLCYYIDKAWWPDFEDEVTIAATSFLPIPGGRRSVGVKKNHFSVWLQAMKVPPLTDEMFQRGKSLQPMRCTVWQESKKNEDMFRYNGTFEPHQALFGQWQQVGKVATMEDFLPGVEIDSNIKWPLQQLGLKEGGKTEHENMLWSDNMLMDLNKLVALEMTPQTIDGTDYLFIEAGGFSKKQGKSWKPDHPGGWKPAVYVMKRTP